MKKVFTTILYQFYQWHLKYALSEEAAAQSAAQLFDFTFSANVLAIGSSFVVLLKVPIWNFPFITCMALLAPAFFLIAVLRGGFVKNRKYMQYSENENVFILPNKAGLTWSYIFCTVILIGMAIFICVFR